MRSLRLLLALVVIAPLALGACSSDSDGKDAGPKDIASKDGNGPEPDSAECKRPPLSYCEPPGSRPICPNNWFCPGCPCAGPFKIAACSVITQDCRWFCTGCFPAEYVGCNDPTASPAILGRCGYCFQNDAGVEVLPDCDKLNAILDAKSPTPAKDASPAPEDAAAATD